MKTIAVLIIHASFLSTCGNDTLTAKAEFQSMGECYEALAKAKIPSNAVAFCARNEAE